jgi:MFS family permease
MRPTARTTWTARALGLLAVGLLVAGRWLSGVGDVGSDLFISAIAIVFSAVGVLVASRLPGNATGWLFIGVGVATGLGTLAGSYADAWVAGGYDGSRRLGETAAWYGTLSWIPFILVPCTFVLLLFPDGRLLSPRWRWVAWCAGAGVAGVFITTGLAPGPLEDQPQLDNPFGIDTPLLAPLTGLAVLLLVIGMAGSAASAVARFRHAHGERRQQMKWLALAGTVVAVTVPVATAGSDVLWGDTAVNIACMLAVLGLPIAAGIAILRHRLYDIDVVINRTLVYGGLTATLAAAYLALVLLIGLAIGRSGLAVAVSTLAVAALFGPARARIQAGVDRRFYRRRYDATQTLEAFGGRLRDELDLEALAADLRGVVADTVQPAHVSLWLRER